MLMSPWEISDIYSGPEMSAILMNTPKIKFLGIRFLSIALKSQNRLGRLYSKIGDRYPDS